MHASGEEKRIEMIDIARFYAIALVFYGHFIERMMILGNPAAALQYKFIYSFHMVLFVVLAGFVAREGDVDLAFGTYLKNRLLTRLLPFLFFTAIFVILPAFFPGDFFFLKLPSIDGYVQGLILTAFGLPLFCVPSWFILMLFSIELIHYLAFRFLQQSTSTILAGALLFYIAGYWLNLYFDLFNAAKGRVVGWNYLYVHEAITMYAFYLLGILLRRHPALIEKLPIRLACGGAIISILIVAFSFGLNTGPFNINYHDSVVIMFSSHGSLVWFPITAIAGSLLVLFLARCTARRPMIVWMGKNTLILIFLNGAFYHYINPPVAKWVVSSLAGSFFSVLQAGIFMTIASLMLCIPLVYLFSKYVPQLVGKPKVTGPLLKSFI